MRNALVLVGTLFFAGCDLQGEKQRRAMENNLKQIDLTIKNYGSFRYIKVTVVTALQLRHDRTLFVTQLNIVSEQFFQF